MRTNPGCVLVLALLPLLFVSCDPAAPSGQVDGTCDDLTRGQAAYYDATMKPYFDSYCTTCHSSTATNRRGAPAHANYDTYDAAQFSNFVTWFRSTDGTMPPMGKMPSTAELTTLLDWLNCTLAVQEQNAGDDDDSAQ